MREPSTPPIEASRPVHVVYGFYVHPGSDWRAVMAGQVASLRCYGLLDRAELAVVITDCHATPGLREFACSICGPRASIVIHTDNRFEYWALHHLWRLARAEPRAAFAYLHSKGISRDIWRRSRVEKALTRCTFALWSRVLERLDNPQVDVAGLLPATEGWVWYNFWWAKGAYLAGLPEPVTSDDRFSHEAWLGGGAAGLAPPRTYSLLAGSSRRFSQKEADSRMRALVRWPFLQLGPLCRLLPSLRLVGRPKPRPAPRPA